MKTISFKPGRNTGARFHAVTFVALMIICCITDARRSGRDDVEKELLKMSNMVPIKPHNHMVMFWRPQKVGSSTILSFLTSFAYRYNLIPRRRTAPNSLCIKIANCALKSSSIALTPESRNFLSRYVRREASGTGGKGKSGRPGSALQEKRAESQSYTMSTTHQLCNIRADIVLDMLPCAFTTSKIQARSEDIREIFVVREPTSRSISAYYFWGELFKMRRARRIANRSGRGKHDTETDQRPRLGEETFSDGHIYSSMFTYHGNETTAPPVSIAMMYAQKLPYVAGMPGPSFTWSAFADSLDDALQIIGTDRMVTIVTERLDESLVAASHFLGWSLADMVVTVHRKALSKHPKAKDWPASAVDSLMSKLEQTGEYKVYEAAKRKLDERLSALSLGGVDVAAEVSLLRSLRRRVTKVLEDVLAAVCSFSSFFCSYGYSQSPFSVCVSLCSYNRRVCPLIF